MTNQLKEAERRAQSRAVDAELKIMQQEQARQAELNRQAELDRRERDKNIDHAIINRFANLKPLYEQRQAAYEAMAKALDDFMQIERQIMPTLIRERDKIPGRGGMWTADLRQKWMTLALRAGIPNDHSHFAGGSLLAKTLAYSLINGIVTPGQVAAGSTTLNVTIE